MSCMPAKMNTVIVANLVACLIAGCSTKESDKMTPEQSSTTTAPSDPEQLESPTFRKATFAAGCFWGVEAAFRKVPGVKSTMVGYTGGRTPNPTYRQVCSDKTGHAEAVEMIYDPNEVSYEQLLRVFWYIHDPTTRNRQGPDVGSQYRSAIFYHTSEQLQAAQASKQSLEESGRLRRPVVTKITPAAEFYKAE